MFNVGEMVLKRGLDATIDFHLAVNQGDYTVDGFIGGHAEILGCRVISIDESLDGLGEQWLLPAAVLHEVEEEDVVEEGAHLHLIMEVEIVVQLGELQDHFDSFRLILTGKTAVLSAFENSIAALEDEVRADWVLCPV